MLKQLYGHVNTSSVQAECFLSSTNLLQCTLSEIATHQSHLRLKSSLSCWQDFAIVQVTPQQDIPTGLTQLYKHTRRIHGEGICIKSF